jgi:elongation factor 1-beta
MPEGPEVDLSELEELVKKKIKVHSVAQEPIAFGLKALRVVTSVEDSAGGTEPLEKELASLPGVRSVQVTGLTRLLEVP